MCFIDNDKSDMSGKLCPLTNPTIKHPAHAPGGSLQFEKEALKRWVERHGTNPLNLQPMTTDDIIVMGSVAGIVFEYPQSESIGGVVLTY